MTSVFGPEFWARLLGIVLIDLTLAGDNALVIALAVRALPERQRFWGRVWGTLGAVVLRLILITVATQLLEVPFLQLGGGGLLLWIAVHLVKQGATPPGRRREAGSFVEAVWIIIAADAAMSLDNVVAVAGAARGDLGLVVFGIALSLPLVIWGSGILGWLMDRFPWIIWGGAGVLGYVGGEMMLRDRAIDSWRPAMPPVLELVPVACAVIIAAFGWWAAQRRPTRASNTSSTP